MLEIKYVIFILFLITVTVSTNNFEFCPVSLQTSTTLSYPSDLFNQNQIKFHFSESSYKNCSMQELGEPTRKCKNQMEMCPIDSIDMNFFREKSLKIPNYNSICSALRGSVTNGWKSDGCICDNTLNNNCQTMKWVSTSLINLDRTSEIHCRWGTRLEEWFTLTYPNSIVLVLALAGSTSPFMADIFDTKLRQNGIFNLTSNDIIFIDHSVNDAFLTTPKGQTELIDGLDRFIRKIYKFSIEGSWPTVILLEMWPFVDMYIDEYRFPDCLSSVETKYDYSKVYVKIAENYNLPIWSYRDLIWSEHFERKYDSYTISLMRFARNEHKVHPPWPVHVYFADLVASNINYELELCINKSNEHVYPRQNMFMNKLKTSIAENEVIECNDNIEYMLDLSAYPNEPIQIGKVEVNPENAFRRYTDRKLKYGWIDEILVNDTSLMHSYQANITFLFDNHHNKLLKTKRILKIHYFRTYFNGGIADVYLCDKYITTIDALWVEVRSSETTMIWFIIDSSHYKYCNNMNEGRLTFIHKYSDDMIDARVNQKMKIVSVKICQAE